MINFDKNITLPAEISGLPDRVEALEQNPYVLPVEISGLPDRVEALEQNPYSLPAEISDLPDRVEALEQNPYVLPAEISGLPNFVFKTVGVGGDYPDLLSAVRSEFSFFILISDIYVRDFSKMIPPPIESIFGKKHFFTKSAECIIYINESLSSVVELYFENCRFIQQGSGLTFSTFNIEMNNCTISSTTTLLNYFTTALMSGSKIVLFPNSYRLPDVNLFSFQKVLITQTTGGLKGGTITLFKGGIIENLEIVGDGFASETLITVSDYAKINSAFQSVGTVCGYISLANYSELKNAVIPQVLIKGKSIVRNCELTVLKMELTTTVVEEISGCVIGTIYTGNTAQTLYDVLTFKDNHITSTTMLTFYSHMEVYACKFNCSLNILSDGVTINNCKVGSVAGGAKIIQVPQSTNKNIIVTNNITEGTIYFTPTLGSLNTNNTKWA